MQIDIPIADDEIDDFINLAANGLANLNWESEDYAVITLTPLGRQIVITAAKEALTVPDDPIALQAQVEMWKERALKAERRAFPVHDHDIDPSCKEYINLEGRILGECVIKNFRMRSKA